MRIRYAYKLELADGTTSFVVLNHIKSEEEVVEMYADKGVVTATFHERVRTGYKLDETGALVETGLIGTRKPAAAPAASEAPAKKAKKSSKKSSK